MRTVRERSRIHLNPCPKIGVHFYLLLGAILLGFPGWIAEFLGLPGSDGRFYPTVLGAILIGIGIALLLERFRGKRNTAGLGLAGALSINISFGVGLGVWLLGTAVELTAIGALVLWGLVFILLGLSGLELAAEIKGRFESGAM